MSRASVTLPASSSRTRVDIDALFESRRRAEKEAEEVYDRVLGRVNARVEMASKARQTSCWYNVPEFVFGRQYDASACTAHVISRLKANGFLVAYYHPNVLLVSWGHWVPKHKREEYLAKYGVAIDQFGNEIPAEAPPPQPVPSERPRFVAVPKPAKRTHPVYGGLS